MNRGRAAGPARRRKQTPQCAGRSAGSTPWPRCAQAPTIAQRCAVRIRNTGAITLSARTARRAAGPASGTSPDRDGKAASMLETLIVVLVILWLLGLLTSYTLGGFIHVLLVLALVVLVLRMVRGRRIA
jgi:hypothetical protein